MVPVLTIPIRGNTVGSIMKALDAGLKKKLKCGDRSSDYFESNQKYPFPGKMRLSILI